MLGVQNPKFFVWVYWRPPSRHNIDRNTELTRFALLTDDDDVGLAVI